MKLLNDGGWPVSGPKVTLAEGRQHLERVVNQIEGIRWQLLGVALSLPEPIEDKVPIEDIDEVPDPAAELRTTIACVLDDSIRPALRDLRVALAGTGEEP